MALERCELPDDRTRLVTDATRDYGVAGACGGEGAKSRSVLTPPWGRPLVNRL